MYFYVDHRNNRHLLHKNDIKKYSDRVIVICQSEAEAVKTIKRLLISCEALSNNCFITQTHSKIFLHIVKKLKQLTLQNYIYLKFPLTNLITFSGVLVEKIHLWFTVHVHGLKPVFHLANLFARREGKTRIRQRDWLTLVGEKIRREQVGTVPTFFSVRANKFAKWKTGFILISILHF